MTEQSLISWENFIAVIAIFAFLALVIERSLYQVFDSKLWKKIEEVLDTQAGGDFLDLKPWISVAVSIAVVFRLKIDMVSMVYNRAEPDFLTLVLTGLFIAGGSTGIYKFLKRARKLKEAINQAEIAKHK
ncbi:MAG: hypothetical protein J7L22_07335 [Candidatus Marinimicrobia bacterium]|nr:hypothetical protein [Candidatus Neomarinimicrobiota bacterium]RKY58093.1 MAG: hypothetical protein DRP96_08970 [Candidatus Neomarinimicrobiota bacterium]